MDNQQFLNKIPYILLDYFNRNNKHMASKLKRQFKLKDEINVPDSLENIIEEYFKKDSLKRQADLSERDNSLKKKRKLNITTENTSVLNNKCNTLTDSAITLKAEEEVKSKKPKLSDIKKSKDSKTREQTAIENKGQDDSIDESGNHIEKKKLTKNMPPETAHISKLSTSINSLISVKNKETSETSSSSDDDPNCKNTVPSIVKTNATNIDNQNKLNSLKKSLNDDSSSSSEEEIANTEPKPTERKKVLKKKGKKNKFDKMVDKNGDQKNISLNLKQNEVKNDKMAKNKAEKKNKSENLSNNGTPLIKNTSIDSKSLNSNNNSINKPNIIVATKHESTDSDSDSSDSDDKKKLTIMKTVNKTANLPVLAALPNKDSSSDSSSDSEVRPGLGSKIIPNSIDSKLNVNLQSGGKSKDKDSIAIVTKLSTVNAQDSDSDSDSSDEKGGIMQSGIDHPRLMVPPIAAANNPSTSDSSSSSEDFVDTSKLAPITKKDMPQNNETSIHKSINKVISKLPLAMTSSKKDATDSSDSSNSSDEAQEKVTKPESIISNNTANKKLISTEENKNKAHEMTRKSVESRKDLDEKQCINKTGKTNQIKPALGKHSSESDDSSSSEDNCVVDKKPEISHVVMSSKPIKMEPSVKNDNYTKMLLKQVKGNSDSKSAKKIANLEIEKDTSSSESLSEEDLPQTFKTVINSNKKASGISYIPNSAISKSPIKEVVADAQVEATKKIKSNMVNTVVSAKNIDKSNKQPLVTGKKSKKLQAKQEAKVKSSRNSSSSSDVSSVSSSEDAGESQVTIKNVKKEEPVNISKSDIVDRTKSMDAPNIITKSTMQESSSSDSSSDSEDDGSITNAINKILANKEFAKPKNAQTNEIIHNETNLKNNSKLKNSEGSKIFNKGSKKEIEVKGERKLSISLDNSQNGMKKADKQNTKIDKQSKNILTVKENTIAAAAIESSSDDSSSDEVETPIMKSINNAKIANKLMPPNTTITKTSNTSSSSESSSSEEISNAVNVKNIVHSTPVSENVKSESTNKKTPNSPFRRVKKKKVPTATLR